MKARSVNEIRVADKGIYIDEEYMDDVLTAIIHGNMGFFGGVGEEGQVRDSFEEKILDDPELSRIFSGAVKRHVPARMAAKKLWSIMLKKGMDDYGSVLENTNENMDMDLLIHEIGDQYAYYDDAQDVIPPETIDYLEAKNIKLDDHTICVFSEDVDNWMDIVSAINGSGIPHHYAPDEGGETGEGRILIFHPGLGGKKMNEDEKWSGPSQGALDDSKRRAEAKEKRWGGYDNPADQGIAAAKADQYDNSDYVLLKIRNNGYRKPGIKVLAIGTKEEMENMKAEVDATRKKYGGGYELSVHRVG